MSADDAAGLQLVGVNNGRVPNGDEYFCTLLTENMLFSFVYPVLRKYRLLYGLLTAEEQVHEKLGDQFNQLFQIEPDGNEKIKPNPNALA